MFLLRRLKAEIVKHKSVLLNEVLQWLDLKPGRVIVDGTLGYGGHASEILRRIIPQGRLLGFDKDPGAVTETSKVLGDFGDCVMIFHEDFKNIPTQLESLGQKADGVFLDLGVSSPQLDEARRGFSFKSEGPLDMRMNPEDPLTAREVVNTYPKQELAEIFWKYGEERFSRRIAEKIAQVREKRRIETTTELESIIWQAVPNSYRHGRIHPATRAFQALRIEVNKEIEALEIFLLKSLDVLSSGGRLVIISFHSLEDRIVKNTFREFAKEAKGKILTKKPVIPALEEIQENPRSRSAKLRVFQKV